MTEQDIRIMSAPPEQWEAAKHYESTNAYIETHRKPMYPREDFINLSGASAEKLYRIGLACQPIHPREAALPIFNVSWATTFMLWVQRVITIFLDKEDDFEISTTNRREITLSLWSVAGHWRVTKSGKRVWIAPYYKGKDRNKQNAAFCAKEYRFDEEVTDNA